MNWFRNFLVALLLGAVGAALIGSPSAGWAAAEPAASDWAATAQAKLRLVSAVTGSGGAKSVPLGLQFQLAPGWKTYWRSPGDAGIPVSLDWSGSANLAGADIAWPVPRRFTLFGLDTFGYEDEVVFPIAARPADPAKPLTLRLKVDYLVCEKICIPQSADLALDLPASAPAPSDFAQLIDRYQEPGAGRRQRPWAQPRLHPCGGRGGQSAPRRLGAFRFAAGRPGSLRRGAGRALFPGPESGPRARRAGCALHHRRQARRQGPGAGRHAAAADGRRRHARPRGQGGAGAGDGRLGLDHGAAGGPPGRPHPQSHALRAAGAVAEAAGLRRPWRDAARARAPQFPGECGGGAGELPPAGGPGGRVQIRGACRRLGLPVPAAAVPRRHGPSGHGLRRQSLGLLRGPAAGLRRDLGQRLQPPRAAGRFLHRRLRNLARHPLHRALPGDGPGLRAGRRAGGDLRDFPGAGPGAGRALSAAWPPLPPWPAICRGRGPGWSG